MRQRAAITKLEGLHMKRTELTRRELADMLESNRDTVKYLDQGFRELVEKRHCPSGDDLESDDFGDRLIACRTA